MSGPKTAALIIEIVARMTNKLMYMTNGRKVSRYREATTEIAPSEMAQKIRTRLTTFEFSIKYIYLQGS